MARTLDLVALRSFVAVVDSGGVTRAAGLLNLTQSLAQEWGPDGVRVNAISAGPIKTLADELGYANASALSRVFTARTGMSPRDWGLRTRAPIAWGATASAIARQSCSNCCSTC